MEQNPVLLAFEHYQAGRLEPAADLLRAFLAGMPFDAAANHLLGGIYYRQGKYGLARDHWARACATPGATAEMFNNYGAALKALGDVAGAVAAYRRALGVDPNYADALNNLGVIYRAQGQSSQAIEILRRAASLKPDLAEAQKNLRTAYNDVVPAWHFAMINDRPRNDAYAAAIARAAFGKRVLDIGTGTGLLAMMAAKAGAVSVTTCEAVPVIAERARTIIARNGLQDRITVLARHSTDIAVGRELTAPAEVLITETFSSDLLSEGVLATVEHAHRQLLAPGAVVIPRAAGAKAYLIGGAEIEGMLFAGSSHGFDLSPFNDFAPPLLAASVNSVPHDVLSDDVELVEFDLFAREFPMGTRVVDVKVARDGVASGLVQWIHLDLDGQVHYENRPSREPHAESHWTQIIHRFSRPVRVERGAVLRIGIRHDREHLLIDLLP